MNEVLSLIEIALLVTALQITTAPSVKLAILYYRIQSFLLASIPVLTAISGRGMDVDLGLGHLWVSILIISLLPLLLGIFVKQLLGRATIGLHLLLKWKKFFLTKSEEIQTERIWQEWELPKRVIKEIFVFGGLIALSAWVSFQVIQTKGMSFGLPEQIGLMVSLSLYLSGLFNTFNKDNIVSQVIGLLTMDQGLILAAIKIVTFPYPAVLFIIGLYFYTMVTLVILLVMVPKIRSFAQSIDLDELAKKSNLEG